MDLYNIETLYLFRLIHRPVEENVLITIRQKIDKDKAKHEKLAAKEFQRQNSAPSGQAEPPGGTSSSGTNISMDTDQKTEDTSKKRSDEKMEVEQTQQTERKTEQAMDTDVSSESQAMNSKTSGSQSEGAVAATSQPRDPIDELNEVPGITVIRPGQFPLTPQEEEVRHCQYKQAIR